MTTTAAPGTTATARRSALRRVPPSVLLSFLVIAVVVAWSVAPGLFTGYDPVDGVPAELSRVIHGTASSVSSALVAVAIAVVVGGLIGLLAGFLGGAVDVVLARFVDVLLAIPRFLLAVVIVSALGFETVNAAVATGISAVAVFARVLRSEVLKTRSAVFVEAAFLLGGSRWHVLMRHVLPNASRSVLPLAVLEFGLSIITIAGLAFLGYGDPPPASDWGLLVSTGKDYPLAPWLVWAPAFVTIVTVLSVNRISRWLRKTD